MVMIVIVSLGILAGGLSYSMKIETRLARNAMIEPDLEWLGRSGVEFAKLVLSIQPQAPGYQSDSLNQFWAGGFGDFEELYGDMHLDYNRLGPGFFSIKIVDLERKFNINFADDVILNQALMLAGVDASESTDIVNSIKDWMDPDDYENIGGAESDYYLGLKPGYLAKNGPVDYITELLKIKGIREYPEVFFGPSAIGPQQGGGPRRRHSIGARSRGGISSFGDQEMPQIGLADLFTTLSAPTININTASAINLQIHPFIDSAIAHEIIEIRSGPDGVDGTEDDMPFSSAAELGVRVPGFGGGAAGGELVRYFNVRSATFQVKVTAQYGRLVKEYFAILRRENAQVIQTLLFFWD